MVIANHVSVSRRTFLDQATDRLRKAGIEEARKEARLLIEDVADISIAHQLAFPDILLSDKQLAALDEALAMREARIPLSQIVGKASFTGRLLRPQKTR
jgi:release factor glutamine methyltransferase